jgi:hypothetical protein
MKLTTGPYPVPSLIMSGSIPPLHLRLHVMRMHNFILYLEEKTLPVGHFAPSEEHHCQQNVCLCGTQCVEVTAMFCAAKLMITKPTRKNGWNIWMEWRGEGERGGGRGCFCLILERIYWYPFARPNWVSSMCVQCRSKDWIPSAFSFCLTQTSIPANENYCYITPQTMAVSLYWCLSL